MEIQWDQVLWLIRVKGSVLKIVITNILSISNLKRLFVSKNKLNISK